MVVNRLEWLDVFESKISVQIVSYEFLAPCFGKFAENANDVTEMIENFKFNLNKFHGRADGS